MSKENQLFLVLEPAKNYCRICFGEVKTIKIPRISRVSTKLSKEAIKFLVFAKTLSQNQKRIIAQISFIV